MSTHLDCRLPRTPGAAPAARREVARLLEGEGAAAHPGLALVVTELVANAVAHGRGRRVRLHVEAREGRALVAVQARARRFAPAVAPAPEAATRGRGLVLVDALAASWGVERRHLGVARVWAEVALGP